MSEKGLQVRASLSSRIKSRLSRHPRPGPAGEPYNQDGLVTSHNHEFMGDPDFVRAYNRAVKAGGFDYGIHWRVHVALWVAENASHLPGDFVECGTARGYISSAILESLEWDALGKSFYLFDTFSPFNAQEEDGEVWKFYADGVEEVRDNFAEWPSVHLVPGMIPGTLDDVDVEQVAYLHIDLNHPDPEADAVRHFWPKLVRGGWMLLDDYAYVGYRPQKLGMDALAREFGFNVLSLPTGQGLVVKDGRG